MKRATAKTPVRVYKYGCLAPVANAEKVEEQIRLGHQMYNSLVEHERANREAYRALLLEDAELAAATKAYLDLKEEGKTLRDAIKKRRAQARARKVDISAETARLAELKTLTKEASTTLKAVKKDARERLKVKTTALATEDKAAVKAIRQDYMRKGLYVYSYNRVLEMFEQARNKTRMTGAMPKFHRYDGSGFIAYQVVGGMSTTDVFGANKKVELDSVPAEAYETRSGRRNLTKTTLRFRIGSEGPGNRIPIFAEFPIKLHRPLPLGGEIKFAQLTRKRIGRRFQWNLTVTVRLPEAPAPRRVRRSIAIDVGWRKRDSTYRHAYWYDSDGNHGEWLLPERYASAFPHLDSIQTIRSENFNAIQAELIKFRQDNEKVVPTWYKDETRYMFQWNAPRKMARLLRTWKESRFDGDETALAALQAYVTQEDHLWDWESSKRAKVIGWRKDLFNNLAHKLTKEYDCVFVEDINHQDLAKRAAPEQANDNQTDAMRRARAMCSPGALIESFEKAMAKTGGYVVRVNPAYTTRICHVCGADHEWDQTKLDHTCKACGSTWDQDKNAAINIFRLGLDEADADSKAA